MKTRSIPEKSFSVPSCYGCEVSLENIGMHKGKIGWKCPECGIVYRCTVCATCGKTLQPWARTSVERNIIIGREVCQKCWTSKERWDDGKCPRCDLDLWAEEGMMLRLKPYSEKWWVRKDIRTILKTIRRRIRLREQEAKD